MKTNKTFTNGSSETRRKEPFFSFANFYKYGHAKHVPRIEESFLEWFIGFFEGDGSLSSHATYGPYIQLRFSISQKENY